MRTYHLNICLCFICNCLGFLCARKDQARSSSSNSTHLTLVTWRSKKKKTFFLPPLKQWNEVTKLFRAGMPVKKHRQHLKVYLNCFTATTAVDWLHDLLRNNCNFGPEVTRQQTVQLLKKFLKNHVIEDVKGRWGVEDLEDNNQLYRYSRLTKWLCCNCSIHFH